MGNLVSSTIPSLISGVSQQPWNVRLVTQAEEQVNCYSSVVDFMKRRPATRNIAKLTDFIGWDSNTTVVHHIDRDQQEQYVVLAGHRKLEVFDMQGNRKHVAINQAGFDYLDCIDAPTSPLKFLTINDYTFVCNKRHVVQMLPDVTPTRPPEALAFIKQASYNTTYTLELDGVTYPYSTSDGLSSTYNATFVCTRIKELLPSWAMPELTEGGISIQIDDGHTYELVNLTEIYSSDTRKEYGVSGGAKPAPSTSYGFIIDGLSYLYTSPANVRPDEAVVESLSSTEIIANLIHTIPSDIYAVATAGSTIFIQRKDGADFKLKMTDSRSDSHTSLCKSKVQNFADLPVVAPRGFTIEIAGDNNTSFDNYYCVFEPSGDMDSFGPGVWKETIKPGSQYRINPATLPHALIRQADGTFTFGPLAWTNRVCGDAASAPNPSFVGRSINAVFLYRNRLSFLSGENVIMSEAGEFFNFFPTTITTMVDNDPVDVAASHVRPTDLQHVTVFSGGLLLFTADAQFTLEHDTVLSNATASIKSVTEFAASMWAEPVSSGKTVFFAVERGFFAGIREYLTLPDNTDQNDAADVTSHVPRYIGGHLHKLICSTNEDVLFALARNAPNQIWVYKYFWNGTEKVQSAWSRWVFSSPILSGFMVETDLYLLMRHADGLYLEVLSLEPGFKDEGADFEIRLDRKITEADVIMIYEPDTRHTTIALPFVVSTLPVCVSRQGYVYPSMQLEATGRSFKVKGDARNKPLFVGLPYESAYTFSTFAIRDQNNGGNAVMAGRLQLRSLSLSCADTGFLTVNVTPKFRDTSTYNFTARELGHGSNIIGKAELYTGLVKVPVLSLNTQVTVGITSSSVFPFALVNATWEGFYNTRSQRT